jgi:hypothetical protein
MILTTLMPWNMWKFHATVYCMLVVIYQYSILEVVVYFNGWSDLIFIVLSLYCLHGSVSKSALYSHSSSQFKGKNVMFFKKFSLFWRKNCLHSPGRSRTGCGAGKNTVHSKKYWIQIRIIRLKIWKTALCLLSSCNLNFLLYFFITSLFQSGYSLWDFYSPLLGLGPALFCRKVAKLGKGLDYTFRVIL